MKFTPIRPLTKFGRVSRSIILVALIIGGLFPEVGGIGVAAIASPLALVVVIYEIGRWIPKIHPVLLVPAFFGILALHAMAHPPATEYGATKHSMWFTSTLLTALAASLLRDERAVITFARTWLIASGLLAVVTIAGFGGGRGDGFDSNPIWLARAMATAIVIALFLVMQKHLKAWIFLLAAALLTVGILATGSRGPTLAVALGAIALVIFTRRHRIRRIVGIAIGAGIAYWAVTKLPFFAESRIATMLSEGNTDPYRPIFWAVTPPMIAEHPEGVGIGNWLIFAGAPSQFTYPHSLFLEVFAEFGVLIGVGLVVVVLAILVALLVRSKEMPVAILIFALLVVEIAQVSVSGDLNARTFWFLLTLGFFTAVRFVLPDRQDSESSVENPVSATR